jgi:O-antigen/teichoic acid export membrane protein
LDTKNSNTSKVEAPPSVSVFTLGDTRVAACPKKSTDPNQRHFATDHLLSNLRNRTVSSSVVTTISQGIQFALNLASISVLARLLTPRDFGLVAMVTSIMGFLQVFQDAGLSTATVQREGITHAQVSNLFWVNVVLSGSVSLLVAGCAPLIARFYHEPRLISITLALSVTFLLVGSTVQHMALLNRQMRFKLIAFIQVGSMAVGVAVGISMAVMGCGFWSLVGMNLTTPIVAFLLTWTFSRWRPQIFSRNSGTRPLLNFGANMAAGSFFHALSRNADGLLIGRFYGSDALGLYSRGAVLLTRPLNQIFATLNKVFVPALSRLQNQPERYRQAFLQAYESIALVSFPFTALFLSLAHPLTLVVLGPKWEKAATILASFTMVALYYPLSNVASWLFATQGRGRDALIGFSISSVVTVVSFIAGLPYGPVGVALAYSIACLTILLPVRFYIAGRQGPVGIADLWMGFLRYMPLWFVVWISSYMVRRTVAKLFPLEQVVICVPVGLAAGAVFVCLVAPLRRSALNLLNALRELRKA